MGRKLGDRKDGALLWDIDSIHFAMPLMYPNWCDNEAYISERILGSLRTFWMSTKPSGGTA